MFSFFLCQFSLSWRERRGKQTIEAQVRYDCMRALCMAYASRRPGNIGRKENKTKIMYRGGGKVRGQGIEGV